MKTEESSLKKIGKKYKIRWVKNRLNSVKKWLFGTQVEISVKGRLQHLPGLKQQYFVIRGRKSRHSPKVVELLTRTGCKFHRGTSRRRMLYMGRAKGECPSVRFFLRVSQITYVQQIHNSIFRYNRPKPLVRPLRVCKCSMNPRPRPVSHGREFGLHFHTSRERITYVASCIEPYFSMHAKLKLVHRFQTSKVRHNLTSLNIFQHDVNIVTDCVARRRYTALMKLRTLWAKHSICI